MKILHISDTDLAGQRFNGHYLSRYFIEKGIDSKNYVWMKNSDSEYTSQVLGNMRGRGFLRGLIAGLEYRLSIHAILYPFSFLFPYSSHFKASDIIHYHLIHQSFFSLLSLPRLTRMKPTLWTLHDPWAMTGHCIYPFDCKKWETGCGDCPDLNILFPMRRDNTALMWKIKKWVYHRSDIDIVVASKWMLDMARRSPLTSNFRFHLIPFGVDLKVFRPLDSEEAKRSLGVFPGSTVVSFRATESQFKGLSYIKESLDKLTTDQPVCLLTFHGKGLVDEFRGRYQIIDLGWVDDEELTVRAYNATDIFLMPSTAEAFGMMAMEAMACGKPVITFEGTSLPEVVFAPEGGIAVPQGDSDALRQELERLIDDSEARSELGAKALTLARQHYNFDDHAEKMLELYKGVISRREAESL